MTPLRKTAIAFVVLAAAFACLVPAQKRLDAARAATFDEELLYLPNEKLLNHFTGGLSSVVADLLWLKCIQDTAMHFRGDRKFTWLNHMCDTITRLDPLFGDVYRYGGVFLAALKADDDASIDLLKRGIPDNPDRWELPYEIATVYLLNRKDQPGSQELAARYLAMAAATGHAPDAVIEFANNLQRRYNLADVERTMWQEMAQSDDRFMREMAERKLQELTIRENCAILNEVAKQFEAQQGRRPDVLDDLVAAGIINRIPLDPFGGTYFIDADGSVKNTTILDQTMERYLNRIRFSVEKFHGEYGRWPRTLQEACDTGHLRSVPPHPYAGRQWHYEPATGKVE